jgi:phage terminase large subunit GpA-like protein
VRLLSRREIVEQLGKLSAGEYCADPVELAQEELYNLLPAQSVSTLECAEKHRYFRAPEGDAKIRWERERTPYLVGPMDALDNPNVREVIMPKPGRSGGTAAFECYEFKLMRFGPMTDMLIYLGSDSEVDAYCDKGFRYLFEDHPEIQAKIGAKRTDDKLKSKKVAGRSVEVLQANNKTVTGRQAGWMRIDEIDTFTPRLAATMLEQVRIRGRQLGNWRKVGITSHPDRGWAMGVAQAWVQSSQGIYVWQCHNCGGYGSPYPTKYWPDVPRFTLDYERLDDDAPADARVKLAQETAVMRCPHCKTGLDDKQRFAMIDEGQWMHKGQHLDIDAGIIGEPDDNPAHGFWIHGLMVKQVTNAELARDLEGAIAHHRSTGKTDKLKEVLAKVFGEVFEGANGAARVSAVSLRKRAQSEAILRVGECPPDVRFITAAVDVGAAKFDISFRGWDLESRSWWLNRLTVRQIVGPDGQLRDLRTRERIEDWDCLYSLVIDRLFPIIGRPGMAMPVAAIAIDVGDGNVTWKGREFARRALACGRYWGPPTQPWSKVRLIQGSRNPNAAEVPEAPTKIDKDEHGHPVAPIILEYSLGVSKLKRTVVDWLGVNDGGPGQCLFADGIESKFYDEYFNEREIDGKWERSGPNESLDLFAYELAVRQMLKPDRAGINWDTGPLPPWARPVPVNVGGGDQLSRREVTSLPAAPPKARESLFERFDALSSDEGNA